MNDDIKKGLLGIVVDETEVSKVMPEINSLTYRGYAAQDLCEYCRFEEVAYLILNKDLPNTIELRKFEKEERNQRELTKNVLLGRLETSEDFKVSEKKKEPAEKQTLEIENLKITVRLLTKDDIKERKLPNQITGVVVTKINDDSPLKNTTLAVNDIITEAQKRKIRSIKDLEKVAKEVVGSNQKTILLATYNSQNQRRYLGVKLK